MKLTKKQIYTLISSLLLVLIGIILLSFRNLMDNANYLFYYIMDFYALIKLIEYFLTKKAKEYKNLLIAIVSLLAGSIGFIFNLNDTPMVLSITLTSWVSLVSIIKLIKVDYLMDRQNKMWYIEIIFLGIFILIGILTSINLYFNATVQILVLGFFFLINGILEMVYPLIDALNKRNIIDKE